MISIEILNNRVPEEIIKKIIEAINREYPFLRITGVRSVKLPLESYNASRKQYNATLILSKLEKMKKTDYLLIVTSSDLYAGDMNFIFGEAIFYSCAVLSIARLKTFALIQKEAVHEVGHVLGLQHCKLPCVMTFSNSIYDASKKSGSLCEKCRKKLDRYMGEEYLGK
ncbi:MAG: peptidase [Candidatus Parvarchaeota archaeon]|nr:peptidase [Candidatus Jingweiarchaeum tengchongense]MCW1298240.1 peptidase [Candidatus Jingweiarchaeum tengchongense]MCW1300038.1 peptidase [Candidatus Jingweiarchaeum tengchongense]MCW1304823.1 peptidase [Candidatus Jingweiarchaeum tengchongense]MCW1305413.1 peptidase [Candidatus Jingweiarchaeum tengchongense]